MFSKKEDSKKGTKVQKGLRHIGKKKRKMVHINPSILITLNVNDCIKQSKVKDYNI